MADYKEISKLGKMEYVPQNDSEPQRCFPRELPNVDLEKLENITKYPPPVSRGAHLFREGEACQSIFVVRTGSVKTYIPLEDGDEQVLGFHLARELLGLEALNDEAHISAAVALEPTEVCEIPLKQLEEICKDLPDLRHEMHKLIGVEIANDHKMFMLLGKTHAEQRLASLLLSLADRLAERGYATKSFDLSMSRKDIANYLGLVEETVSRLFTRFQEENILDVNRKHITVLNPERLNFVAVRGF
jgi:CRP/FNR family transcriptional regulator